MKDNEKKVNATEEKGVELTDAELGKVSGGNLEKIKEDIDADGKSAE